MMNNGWQIQCFVPASSGRRWEDDEAAEAWALSRRASLIAGGLPTRNWFGFRMGTQTAAALSDAIERWADATGDDALAGWLTDLRSASLVSASLGDFVSVEPASFQPVELWSFTTTAQDAAAKLSADSHLDEVIVWEPGAIGFWIDASTAHLLLQVPWGQTGTLAALRKDLWTWLIERDAERIGMAP